MNSIWNYSTEMLKSGQNWLFVLCHLEIWRMTLNINRTPFLFYLNLWTSFQRIQLGVTVRKRSIRVKIGDFLASFQSHRWIQTGVTVRKRPIEVEIGDFLSRVTLKFDWWPWKTIGHLFYTTSSFVHHFIAICEFKLELQSGNTLCVKIDDLF